MNYLGSNMQKGYNPHTLQKSLAWMAEAVQGEKEKEFFYEYLISVGPTESDRDLIISIRDDEKEHRDMFRTIYKDFTGQEIKEVIAEGAVKKQDSYLMGIQFGIFESLKEVEQYREIFKGLPEGYYRDAVSDMISDKLKHATMYNFQYTKNLKS